MTTRWRIPPENWCGYWSRRSSAAGMPVSCSRRSARRRASAELDRQVRLDRLDQLLADGVERVERGERVLEDRADRAAAHFPHLLVRQVVDAAAVEADLAAAIRPGGSSRPMIAAPVSDLPAPDSPTTPRISPGRDREGDVVERDQPCRAGRETRRAGSGTSSSGAAHPRA
jgi:hypothetical protein